MLHPKGIPFTVDTFRKAPDEAEFSQLILPNL